MKVDDFFPIQVPTILEEVSEVAVAELMAIRRMTFMGFVKVEQTRGFMKPNASISSSHGQEMVRTLLIRGLEELGEADEANEETHVKEEAIDAINFLMSILIFDPSLDPRPMNQAFLAGWDFDPDRPFMTREALLYILEASFPLLAKLRNRAWQNNPQSTYFDGYLELCDFANEVGFLASMAFGHDWPDFVSYFLAKDKVLQWRLKTKY